MSTTRRAPEIFGERVPLPRVRSAPRFEALVFIANARRVDVPGEGASTVEAPSQDFTAGTAAPKLPSARARSTQVPGQHARSPGPPSRSADLVTSTPSAALRESLEDAAKLGLRVAIAGDLASETLAQLTRALAGPGQLTVIPSSGLRSHVQRLWGQGISPAQIAIVEIPAGDGLCAIAPAIMRQCELRRLGALPLRSSDPAWTLTVRGTDPERERTHESLLALADGRIGTRGTMLVPDPHSAPAVLLAGVYRHRGERSELAPAPLWNLIEGLRDHPSAGESRHQNARPVTRTLDLHTATLHHDGPHSLQALAFSSLAHPGTAVLRATGDRERLQAGPVLVAPAHGRMAVRPTGDGVLITTACEGHDLHAAATQQLRCEGEHTVLERTACYGTTRPEQEPSRVVSALGEARARSFDQLLDEHRRSWAVRWEQSDVRIAGDIELQLAVRLCLYHLIASTGDRGEAALGARGLTGTGYRGHVFWDSDVFALPFFAATHPPSARAILEYRVNRLQAAAEAAEAAGRRGARFAWESAASGFDVTPRSTRNRAGEEVAIHTGQREEHIVADVAWAAACYIDWTGDQSFRVGAGRQLIVETARYWASRIETEADASGVHGHIRGVIGPDEYHELVDDNAYTNVMARWNLRRAYAETTDAEIDADERAAWLGLAEALHDGYDEQRGLYEQFAGFFALDPIIIADVAPRRPIAADLLLGPERVSRAQVIKQADVLMLHHLVPEEVAPRSLGANLSFYEPRTAHGSSLSPGIHAALLARAGRLEEAVQLLRLAARVDLDDISGSTAAGVHIAAMGSVWQAIVYGFLGARPSADALELDPHLPDGWEQLEASLRFRNASLQLRLRPGEIEIDASDRVSIKLPASDSVEITSGRHRATLPSVIAGKGQVEKPHGG